MARHSSVSKKDRHAAALTASLSNKLQKECPAVKSDRWQSVDKLEQRATAHFTIVDALHKRNDPTARRKLREMRDVQYDTDPAPSARGAWDDAAKKGKQSRPVAGRDGKHQQIMKGQSARQSQAKGI